MPEHGRREVRAITVVCLILAGLAVASGVSSTIETVLNTWVTTPLVALGLIALVVAAIRQAWSWLLIEWELHRPLQDDELERPSREEA